MKPTLSLAAVLGTALLGILPAHAIDTNIKSYVCSKLDDFTATMTVIRVNERELSKISKDAVLLYKFKRVQMRYKEPNMVRIEGVQEGTKATFIMTGSEQWTMIPKLGFKEHRQFGDSPGKRKSLLDVGLVSEYALTYEDFQYVRSGTVDGVPVAIFNMTYKAKDKDTSHHLLYIDPKTRVVVKRDSYTQLGKLQAVYYYRDLKEVAPGIFFPTRVEAQNTSGIVAGVTGYQDIKVNTGLPDSLFRL